jgi:hypothetical protein
MSVKGPGPTGPSELPQVDEVSDGAVVEGSHAVDRSAPVSTPTAPDAVTALAGELKAGGITPEQALEKILDMASAHVPPGIRAQVRAELEAALREDPNLAERAKRLGAI